MPAVLFAHQLTKYVGAYIRGFREMPFHVLRYITYLRDCWQGMEAGYLDTYLAMKNGPDTGSDNWLKAEPARGRCGRAKWTPLL